MITLDGSVRIPDHVIFRELAGEAVILNLETGTYLGLDHVGTRMWQLMGENGSLRRVWSQLQDEFEVSPEQLEGDLIGFVGELRASGLVVAD